MHLYNDVATVHDPESDNESDASPVEVCLRNGRQLITNEVTDDVTDMDGIVRTEDGSFDITILHRRRIVDPRSEARHPPSVAPGWTLGLASGSEDSSRRDSYASHKSGKLNGKKRAEGGGQMYGAPYVPRRQIDYFDRADA